MHVASHLLGTVVDAVRRWPVQSQQHARRNAMLASTALAQRRAEREEVEEILAAPGEAPLPRPAAHAGHG